MASIFTRIINGELPGRFVWRDERAVAFLTIQPLKPGHTLVVPIEEVDHWLDLEPDLARHLLDISQTVGGGLTFQEYTTPANTELEHIIVLSPTLVFACGNVGANVPCIIKLGQGVA